MYMIYIYMNYGKYSQVRRASNFRALKVMEDVYRSWFTNYIDQVLPNAVDCKGTVCWRTVDFDGKIFEVTRTG